MASWNVQFAGELNEILPSDLPGREALVLQGAAHLEMIVQANRHFNLTRILSPREAAVKHVLDSVMPWRLFAHARHVLDAGTGAGFPGIPLAIVLPGTRFMLAESIRKKARFVETALARLALPNVSIAPERAEDVVRDKGFDIITARALAPLSRTIALFAPALRASARLLLYKGPDAAQEIADAGAAAKKLRVHMNIVLRYDLPEAMGVRTIVEISSL